MEIMNDEASKREGGRSDWVKDEEGWKSVVTTPDLPNWTPGDTVGELTGSMAYPEDLDSPSSDGTQDRLGRLTWRRAKDNHRGLGLKRVEHIRKRKPAQLEEQQDQENRRRSPAKHIANPLAAKAGKPEYVELVASDTRSRSRPIVKNLGRARWEEGAPRSSTAAALIIQQDKERREMKRESERKRERTQL